MKHKETQVVHIDALFDVAGLLLETYHEARVFAFFGAMGVGKTAFIKAICSYLGVTDMVSSPSFPIVNHYVSKQGTDLYHFDFYRINSLEEVYDLGYEDYLYSGNFCFIEWPEKVVSILPEGCIRVYMEERDGIRYVRF